VWRARRARAAIILSASPRDAFSRARSLSLGVLHRLNPSSIYILCAHKFYADALAREISFLLFSALFRRFAYRFWCRTFFMTAYAMAIQNSQIPNTAKIFVPSECETP